jgi:multicomponent K+:H+ antiporter subunit G
MPILLEIALAALILIGACFAFVGSFGLAKLPDFMTRLHAPTKTTTLGVGTMLLASALYFTATERGASLHELLIMVFLFITAPISAHMLAKTHMLRDKSVQDQLPATGGRYGWATLDSAPSHADALPDTTEKASS